MEGGHGTLEGTGSITVATGRGFTSPAENNKYDYAVERLH